MWPVRSCPQISDPAKQKAWRDSLVDKINGAIDVPILNEEQEGRAIGFVVDLIIGHVTKPY